MVARGAVAATRDIPVWVIIAAPMPNSPAVINFRLCGEKVLVVAIFGAEALKVTAFVGQTRTHVLHVMHSLWLVIKGFSSMADMGHCSWQMPHRVHSLDT